MFSISQQFWWQSFLSKTSTSTSPESDYLLSHFGQSWVGQSFHPSLVHSYASSWCIDLPWCVPWQFNRDWVTRTNTNVSWPIIPAPADFECRSPQWTDNPKRWWNPTSLSCWNECIVCSKGLPNASHGSDEILVTLSNSLGWIFHCWNEDICMIGFLASILLDCDRTISSSAWEIKLTAYSPHHTQYITHYRWRSPS